MKTVINTITRCAAVRNGNLIITIFCIFLFQPVGATTLYSDRVEFMKDIGLFILDDYETGYSSGLSVSDAAMSSVLGETQYVATGHPNGNSAVVPYH